MQCSVGNKCPDQSVHRCWLVRVLVLFYSDPWDLESILANWQIMTGMLGFAG